MSRRIFGEKLGARIMAIADVYDALVSKRPYKEPFSQEKAVSIIKEGSGTQFDSMLVEIFEKLRHLIDQGESKEGT